MNTKEGLGAAKEIGSKGMENMKTLAELNLRAGTGSTVVAIYRGGGDVVLPTGRETLELGDVLAVAGTANAVQQARALLATGPGDSMDRGASSG